LLNTQRSIALIFVAIATLAGCSKQPTASPAAQPGRRIDSAATATITGVVHFSGSVPKPKLIDMGEDPACKGKNEDESLVVHDGRLANVVVYAKQMPVFWDVLEPVSNHALRQDGCRYLPHVLAITAGDSVEVFNNDPTTHNIHAMPHANKEWNASQSPGAEPITKTFNRSELMIPVKCNVHPWMKAYINVMANPFYAVTGPDGSFTIQGLPPGTYTIAAVHERLGEQTAQITVGPKEHKTADFTFKEAPNPASAAR
jgi:plastocyanin